MKTLYRILVRTLGAALGLGWLVACQGELVVPASEEEAAEVLPEYNFQVRQLLDTLTEKSSDTLWIEVYIKQLDFSAPDEHYTLEVSLPTDFPGEVWYNQVSYRSQDWIEVPYPSLFNHTTVIQIVLSDRAKAQTTGQYLISMACRDRAQHEKTANLTLVVPADTLASSPVDTTSITPVEEPTALPQFNFLVRSLSDTLSVSDSRGVTADTVVRDTIALEIYLRQLDFTAPDEKYTLVVTFPAGLDGEIIYQDTTYRSGDWISLAYRELIDYTTLIQLVPRVPQNNQSTQDPSYTITLVCRDRGQNSQSATLTLTL